MASSLGSTGSFTIAPCSRRGRSSTASSPRSVPWRSASGPSGFAPQPPTGSTPGSRTSRWITTARSRCRIPTSRSPAAAARRGPSSAARWSSSRTRIPQDHTTFTLLQERTIDLWLAQLDRIEAASGLAQCISHPDPGYLGDAATEALYAEFLDAVAARPGLWRALPREVAAWWRDRDRDRATPARGEAGIATLAEDGSVALRARVSPVGLPARAGARPSLIGRDGGAAEPTAGPRADCARGRDRARRRAGPKRGHPRGHPNRSRGRDPGWGRRGQVAAPGQAVDRQPRAAGRPP